MYTQHFQLSEKPFNVTPNPRFIFLSKQHREVFAHLLYGLQSRCGFIEITGEVGAGKTTALRTLFHQLESDSYRLALIFNPALSADELLEAICRELGIEVGEGDRRGLVDKLNRYLLAENAAGRTVVLVIDEAQNLAVPVLEQIRLLSNLETETDKLIQIVLVGQPELGELLAQPNLRQFSQRISVRYHLQPMDRDDTAAYIAHRLEVAGRVQPLFSDAAVRAVYRCSRGLPRLINILCDRALLTAYSNDRQQIEKGDVLQAHRELQRGERRPVARRSYWPASVIACAALLLALAFYLRPATSPPSIPPAPAVAGTAAAVTVVDDSALVNRVRQELAVPDESTSFSAAIRYLVTRWRVEATTVPERVDAMPSFLASLADDDWQWTTYTGDLKALLGLDVPVVLELSLPAVQGRRYLAVGERQAESVRIAYAPAQSQSVPVKTLESLYTGRAYVLWRNYLQLASFGRIGQRALDVSQIQDMLQQAGYYDGPITGIYDAPTIDAVTRLQAARGVDQDGRIGPLTLMLLYQQGGTFNAPRLGDGGQGGPS